MRLIFGLEASLLAALLAPACAGEPVPPPPPIDMTAKPIAPVKPPASTKPAPVTPVKPAPQVDFGVQWRAQNAPNRNDLTGNTADSVRMAPGAPSGGSGVSGGVQFKW